MATRKNRYLGVVPIEKITGPKLPPVSQVFSRFLYLYERKATVREASRTAARECMEFWELASLPVRDEHHCVSKLEAVYQRYLGLKKSKRRETGTQQTAEAAFSEQLEDLFDISHSNALNIIRNDEDRAFLESQRKRGRPGYIAGLDIKHKSRQDAIQKRKEEEEARRKRALEEQEESTSHAVLVSSSSSSELDSDEARELLREALVLPVRLPSDSAPPEMS